MKGVENKRGNVAPMTFIIEIKCGGRWEFWRKFA